MKTKQKTTWTIRNLDIKYRNLYEQVADSLEEMIFEGGSDKMLLPTEFELAEKYEVSRSVIREALKILNERGLVSMRAGDGSYVNIPQSAVIGRVLGRVTRFNRISDDKITKVRLLLEVEAAFTAATNATDEEIAELEDINRQMELFKSDLEKRIYKDCEFHNAIARISRNELLAFMVESLTELLRDYIRERLVLNPAGNEDGIQFHWELIKAIKSHNPNKAKKVMHDHIERSYHIINY
ncbi:MAG: FadR family transcriptional regulator [Treponema sp.]|jgi:DNA-binding FadR family transcriptional regulator|nr:FadR family transcriptional regulator [Treponema sp.]